MTGSLSEVIPILEVIFGAYLMGSISMYYAICFLYSKTAWKFSSTVTQIPTRYEILVCYEMKSNYLPIQMTNIIPNNFVKGHENPDHIKSEWHIRQFSTKHSVFVFFFRSSALVPARPETQSVANAATAVPRWLKVTLESCWWNNLYRSQSAAMVMNGTVTSFFWIMILRASSARLLTTGNTASFKMVLCSATVLLAELCREGPLLLSSSAYVSAAAGKYDTVHKEEHGYENSEPTFTCLHLTRAMASDLRLQSMLGSKGKLFSAELFFVWRFNGRKILCTILFYVPNDPPTNASCHGSPGPWPTTLLYIRRNCSTGGDTQHQ